MPKLSNRIEKRGDSYRAQVMIAGRSHSLTGKTKGEVQRQINDLKANAAKGVLPVQNPRLTIEAYLSDWLAGIEASNLADRTKRGYRTDVKNYLVPILGKEKVSQL